MINMFTLLMCVRLGDDRMLIERFIEDPHHIEIQVRKGVEMGMGRIE